MSKLLPLYTKAAAARYMGVSYQAVADRIASGQLETKEIHDTLLVTFSGLCGWKNERSARARALTQTGDGQ